MCDPVTAGIILTAAGTGTQAANQLISAQRQDRATAAGLRRQSETQRQASQRVRERVAEVAQSTPEAERAESLEGFLDTLRKSEDITGAADDPLAIGGARFGDRVASGEQRTRRVGREIAGRESIIAGALNQRRRESAETGDLAGQLSELGAQSAADDFITRLRVASKRPNAFVDFLGAALKGAGSITALKPVVPSEDLLARLAEGSLIDTPVRPPPSIFSGAA